MTGIELTNGLRDLSGRVFNVLGLVKHQQVETLLAELLEITVQQGIGGERNIRIGEIRETTMTVCSMKDGDLELRGKLSGLTLPVFYDACGGDD